MKRSVQHGTFVIEREFRHSPGRVYAAFADPKAKAKWFGGPAGAWQELERRMDFRVGGAERARGRFIASGRVSDFQALYHDVVPERRILYSYSMHVDEKKISVSLATLEFEATGKGTRLIITEQGAFLDGYDDAGGREKGTRGLMDQLEASL